MVLPPRVLLTGVVAVAVRGVRRVVPLLLARVVAVAVRMRVMNRIVMTRAAASVARRRRGPRGVRTCTGYKQTAILRRTGVERTATAVGLRTAVWMRDTSGPALDALGGTRLRVVSNRADEIVVGRKLESPVERKLESGVGAVFSPVAVDGGPRVGRTPPVSRAYA